jgi:hypothetical protein
MLVSADVSQLIQKIIGMGWIISVDTINQIFGISCTMSADTNNLSGIRGVPCRRKTLIMVEYGFAPSGCPTFLPSTPPPPSVSPSPPSMPCRHHHHRQPHLRPRCRVIANPAVGLDAADSVPVVVPDPIAILDPVAPSLRRSVLS